MLEPSAIIAGIGAGITFSLSAYFKKKDQDFSWNKFSTTIVIGAFTGVIVSIFDMPPGVAYDYAVALGIIPIVENLIKIVSRKILNYDW